VRVSESKHENTERLARQQAAERLTDVAYALMTGGPLMLGPGRQVKVPVAGEVVLKRVARSTGDRVELELELSWPTTEAHD
jgi:amphi-Trp domain-containing protein